MMLATLKDGTPDGRLVLVSADHGRFLPGPVQTLQQALEQWDNCLPALTDLAARLAAGEGDPLDIAHLAAPLPRAWQWLDGSTFPSHAELMQRAFNLPPIESDMPLMYQGLSDRFYGPLDEVPVPSEADGIDFEGEFGVITGPVPMGVSAADALGLIRLLVQINDWSLRAIAPVEMKTGFGWIQAKPASSMAPVAVTPETLGEAWADGRICLPLDVEWNGAHFGHPNGRAMAYGFHQLIAHAARTRSLPAGTVIGSGTVSNPDHETVGSTCIAELRGIETIAHGKPRSGFMKFGDTVRMEARLPDGATLFGAIDQRVVRG